MLSWLVLSIAIVSTGTCIFLWFRDARRVLIECKSTVESAAGQLKICRKKALNVCENPETKAVLERSEKIYRQAVDIYNQTRNKPMYFLPACLMGFKAIS